MWWREAQAGVKVDFDAEQILGSAVRAAPTSWCRVVAISGPRGHVGTIG